MARGVQPFRDWYFGFVGLILVWGLGFRVWWGFRLLTDKGEGLGEGFSSRRTLQPEPAFREE